MFIAVLLTMLSSTETGPLDFRCDTLRVDSKAGAEPMHRQRCRDSWPRVDVL